MAGQCPRTAQRHRTRDDPRAERPAGADRRRYAARRTGAWRDRYPAQFGIDHRNPAEGGARKFRARISADPDQTFFGQYFRSEEHTSELQSLMRISYAVFCWKKNKNII